LDGGGKRSATPLFAASQAVADDSLERIVIPLAEAPSPRCAAGAVQHTCNRTVIRNYFTPPTLGSSIALRELKLAGVHPSFLLSWRFSISRRHTCCASLAAAI